MRCLRIKCIGSVATLTDGSSFPAVSAEQYIIRRKKALGYNELSDHMETNSNDRWR